MDRFEEIRQRCKAAKAEKTKGHGIDCAALSWAIVQSDIPYLLSEVDRLQARIADTRNELCLKCGRYREAHNGACNGCRWKKGE